MRSPEPSSLIAFLALGLAFAPEAAAVQGSEEGQRLYERHCALCHQDSGVGVQPTFPALSGNERLGDRDRVVQSIRDGGRRMPPFPGLAVDEVSALASYVRGAWSNDYAPVTSEEVTALLGEPVDLGSMSSVWDGVFTEPQAERGEAVYTGACSFCHGRRLNGAPDDPDMRSSPPLARARFLRVWEGRSLATLFEYTRATMPEDNPSSLTDQEYVDLIAYMLAVGGMSAGDGELRPDAQSLARIFIRPSRSPRQLARNRPAPATAMPAARRSRSGSRRGAHRGFGPPRRPG